MLLKECRRYHERRVERRLIVERGKEIVELLSAR